MTSLEAGEERARERKVEEEIEITSTVSEMIGALMKVLFFFSPLFTQDRSLIVEEKRKEKKAGK